MGRLPEPRIGHPAAREFTRSAERGHLIELRAPAGRLRSPSEARPSWTRQHFHRRFLLQNDKNARGRHQSFRLQVIAASRTVTARLEDPLNRKASLGLLKSAGSMKPGMGSPLAENGGWRARAGLQILHEPAPPPMARVQARSDYRRLGYPLDWRRSVQQFSTGDSLEDAPGSAGARAPSAARAALPRAALWR